MINVVVLLSIAFAIFSMLLIWLFTRVKRVRNGEVKIKPLPFVNRFFIYAFGPTLILQLSLNVDFFGFLVLYIYFIVLISLANHAYKQTIAQK